jgi:uncharacterized membrane protein YoaK (UPF0700 family)
VNIAKIGATALKIYACHILVFTVGAALGAFEAFTILYAMWGPCQ